MKLSWVDEKEDVQIRRQKIHAHSGRYASKVVFEKQSRKRKPSKVEQLRTSQETLRLVPWHSSSDPFNSQAIAFNGLTLRLLHFLLAVWLPSSRIKSMNTFDKDFNLSMGRKVHSDYKTALQQEWSATALLLPCATMLATLTKTDSAIQRQHVALRLRTISRLREALHGETTNIDLTMYLTQALYKSAVTEGDMDEARLHGQSLQRQMREKTDREGLKSFNTSFLQQLLLSEIHRADLTLTESCFDVVDWAPSVLQSQTPDIHRLIDRVREEFSNDMDASILDTPVGSAYLNFRQGLWLWDSGVFKEKPETISQMWVYITVAYYINSLRCTNFYVQARDLAEQHRESSKAAQYWHIQASVALGMQLSQVNHIMDPSVDGSRPYWPRGRVMARAMIKHLQQALQGPELDENLSPLFFSAWSGATWTYRDSADHKMLSDSYFCTVMVELATKLRVRKWQDVKNRIDRFMPAIMASTSPVHPEFDEEYCNARTVPHLVQENLRALTVGTVSPKHHFKRESDFVEAKRR